MVDQHSFEISDYMEYTENQDYAFKGNLKFSDRPPGTAFLAAPFYAASAFLPPPLTKLPSKHDPDNPGVVYVLMLPVLAASLTAVVLFWILGVYFELGEGVSGLTTLAFAFGTMTWKYGSLLYSHATSGLTVMLAVALLLHMTQRGSDGVSARRTFWIGLVAGGSVLMEYTNIIFVMVIGAWMVWQMWRNAGRWPRRWQRLGWLVAGGLVAGAILMIYNTINFGAPLQLSTFNVDTSRWPQNASFLHDFATPIWVGLPALLFYGSDNQGLFWLAPISLLGLLGLRPLWKRSVRDFWLIVGGFVAMLLLFSTSTTFNPATNDGRYLTPFLGLWFVAVGFGIRELMETPGIKARQPANDMDGLPTETRRVASLLVYGLLFVSIYFQVLHIGYAWGHDLSPAVMRPWAAAPENIMELWTAVLPNVGNVPLWWGVLIVAWFVLRVVDMGIQRREAIVEVKGDVRPTPGDRGR
jgi:hypothetical protein